MNIDLSAVPFGSSMYILSVGGKHNMEFAPTFFGNLKSSRLDILMRSDAADFGATFQRQRATEAGCGDTRLHIYVSEMLLR